MSLPAKYAGSDIFISGALTGLRHRYIGTNNFPLHRKNGAAAWLCSLKIPLQPSEALQTQVNQGMLACHDERNAIHRTTCELARIVHRLQVVLRMNAFKNCMGFAENPVSWFRYRTTGIYRGSIIFHNPQQTLYDPGELLKGAAKSSENKPHGRAFSSAGVRQIGKRFTFPI
jgi:hypothetical protein